MLEINDIVLTTSKIYESVKGDFIIVTASRLREDGLSLGLVELPKHIKSSLIGFTDEEMEELEIIIESQKADLWKKAEVITDI